MARRTAAMLGYFGLILELGLGWIAGWDTDIILIRGIAVMLTASLVGWTAGALACEWTLKSDSSRSTAQR
ncbi:MAG: hypothetical protein KGS49_04070 [Planctomycetes bacterium]|nr:hypothetical protein [Planctomycetota bacterium]